MSEHALILDCDGVLADTEKDGHLVAFNQVFDEAGYPFRWSEDEYAKLLKVGGGKERLKAYLLDHPEIELPGMDELPPGMVRGPDGQPVPALEAPMTDARLESAKALAKENPAAMATLVRSWMTEA